MSGILQKIFADQRSFGIPPGQVAYTTPGTYSWVCPAGVTSVCVVCVGAATTAYGADVGGGGAGALGYKNNISVTPGNSYTVVVGAVSSDPNSAAGDSYFINVYTVKGGGSPNYYTRSTYTGDGGGQGGTGGGNFGAGAGGAGGYTGNGGNGGWYSDGEDGAGGGGGGGGNGAGSDKYVAPYYGYIAGPSGGGGGVGLRGQGSNGAGGISGGAGVATQTPGGGGGAGSGGSAGGTPAYSSANGGNGGSYGGAAGSGAGGGGIGYSYVTSSNGTSSAGAVRIIWGAGRSFPSTNTGDV